MISDKSLDKSLRLLLGETTDTAKSTITNCVKLFGKHKNTLIDNIFVILREIFDETPEKCINYFKILEDISSREDFEASHASKIAKSTFDLFLSYDSKKSVLVKPAIEVLIIYTKNYPENIYPLFNNLFAADVNVNYFFLTFLLKCLSLRDQVACNYISGILDLLQAMLKKKESEEYLELFLDIFLASFQVINTKAIPEAFSGIYNQIFDTCITDNEHVRVKAFKFLSVAVATISPFEASKKIIKTAPLILKYLQNPEMSSQITTVAAALFSRADGNASGMQEAIQSLTDPLLNYIKQNYKNFVNQTDFEVLRGIPEAVRALSSIRDHTGGRLVERCLASLHEESSLYVLSNIPLTNEERQKISNELPGLLSQNTTPNQRDLILSLFAEICASVTDVGPVAPQIVRIAAASRNYMQEFERKLLTNLTSEHVFRGLFDAALDPHYISASKLCFAILKQTARENCMSNMMREHILARSFVYLASQYFSPHSKADILYAVGTTLNEAEMVASSNVILDKNCHSCAYRTVTRIFKEFTNTPTFLDEVFNFHKQLTNDSHPDVPGRPLLSTSAQAAFRASLFTICAVANNKDKLSSLVKNVDIKNIEEAAQFADDIVLLERQNPSLAQTLLQKKINKKTEESLGKRVLLLEYGSKQIPPQNTELLFEADIPPVIAAAAQRRILKQICTEHEPNIEMISRLLSSNQTSVCRCAIRSLQSLVKKYNVEPDKEILKKALNVLVSSENHIELIKDLIHFTKSDFNLENLFLSIFEGNSFAFNIIPDFIKNLEHPDSIRTPYIAASISMLLQDESTKEMAEKAEQRIFMCNRVWDNFIMYFMPSSEFPQQTIFLETFFSVLNANSPWPNIAVKSLSVIFNDERLLTAHLANANNFLYNMICNAKSIDTYLTIAKILFEKDKISFVNAMLDREKPAPPTIITLLTNLQALQVCVESALRKEVNENNYFHSSVLRLICTTSKIPQDQKLQTLVFVIFVCAQTRFFYDQILASVKRLTEYFPALESTLFALDAYKHGGDVIDVVDSLFQCCNDELSIFHINPFTKYAKQCAVLGYGRIMTVSTRPLLFELLALKDVAKTQILKVAPLLKRLGPERYGEAPLNELVDLIIDEIKSDKNEEKKVAFVCLESIFRWLPLTVVSSKLTSIIESIIEAMRYSTVIVELFSLVISLCDNLNIVSSASFTKFLPILTVLTLCHCIKDKNFISEKINAFERLSQSARILSCGKVSKDDVAGILKTFCTDCNQQMLADAVSILSDEHSCVRREASFIVCAAINIGKAPQSAHHAVTTILVSQLPDELRIGVLQALKMFPPPL